MGIYFSKTEDRTPKGPECLDLVDLVSKLQELDSNKRCELAVVFRSVSLSSISSLHITIFLGIYRIHITYR